MTQLTETAVQALNTPELQASLDHIVRGIEKESLRISATGHLAQSAHPQALGSALTHPEITTDYSEALLEFITPTYDDITACLAHLDTIQRFTYQQLGDELLWTASMPCVLQGDEHIPLAQYGSSNIGQMKTIYREGLGHRYGRPMQTIAGVHYNFSLPDAFWRQLRQQESASQQLSLQDYKTKRYFDLIRNFRRLVWLPIYLFGASPALCRSFVEGREHHLQPLTKGTIHAPYGTALRMGDLGYQSSAQESLYVNYNSLGEYCASLHTALTTTNAEYDAIGLKHDDRYLQLSTNLLQIENEFYSTIRPKRTGASGEVPIASLLDHGVEYIEVRCIDVNPYLPLGVDEQQLRFIDSFLLYCLLSDSPNSCPDENAIIQSNLTKTVMEGRRPNLELNNQGQPETLKVWGDQILDEIQTICVALDQAHGGDNYQQALQLQRAKLADSSLTPSAQIIADIKQHDIPYFRFALAQSEQHQQYYQARPLQAEQLAHYQALAQKSFEQQQTIEAADRLSFDEFLKQHYQQYDSVANVLQEMGIKPAA